MISIRDFARENGVTYEAIRKKIQRYSKELDGHIHQQGRSKYLDDVAVAFLQQHKAESPLVIYDGESAEDVQDLRDKVAMLQDKLIAAQELALASQGALVEAQAARMALAAAEEKQDQLEKDAEIARLEATEARLREQEAIRKAQELQNALDAAEAREKALKERSWWERLTRKGE